MLFTEVNRDSTDVNRFSRVQSGFRRLPSGGRGLKLLRKWKYICNFPFRRKYASRFDEPRFVPRCASRAFFFACASTAPCLQRAWRTCVSPCCHALQRAMLCGVPCLAECLALQHALQRAVPFSAMPCSVRCLAACGALQRAWRAGHACSVLAACLQRVIVLTPVLPCSQRAR